MSAPDTFADERRALLARILERRMAEQSFALSYPQRRLWFVDQLQPERAVYNVPLGYRIRGTLDVAALEAALSELVRRHEVLRSAFRSEGGEPRAVVHPHAPPPLPLDDLCDEARPRARAEEIARAEARRPFDLAAEAPLRARLLRLAPGEHRLLLTLHHIVCDGPSVEVLEREVAALYGAFRGGAPSPLAPLPIQYADFAEWQLRTLRGPPLDDLLAFWKARLQGAAALAGLPTDHPRPPVQSYRGAHVPFALPRGAVERLERLARREGATPFAALLALFAAFLQRYTGEDEVVVGTPVANRARPELEGLVGFFANTLVLRAQLADDPSFTELVRRMGAEARAAVAHQELPFERLVEELHPDRDLARNPLFQVLFSYRQAPPEGLALPGAEVEPLLGDSGTAKFDLTLSLTRSAGALDARLEYATDLFERSTAIRMAAQLRTLLEGAADDPSARISALPLLPEAERRRLVHDWNAAAAELPRETVPRAVARLAAADPGADALVADGETLSRGELQARVGRLAARLRALGVGPDVPVGVYLDRSAGMVVAMLGVMEAGGAYLPLDPAYPGDRLAFMVSDSGAPVVVTRAGLARRVPRTAATVACVDAPEGDAAALPAPAAQAPEPEPESTAYLIYTSGSTGRPKGVAVSHRNVAAFFSGMDALLGADAAGTWLAVTSISFDISVLEILWTLARGYRVVLRREEPTAASAAPGAAVPAAVRARPMDFSLFYFGGDFDAGSRDRYRLLKAGARFADRNGFAAVWTPERHFHRFGGLFPNPAVTGAAVAALTSRVQVRAGSVVLPLHDPLRVAEEWSVVDNLSGGRVGVSFASGWQPVDFVLAPDAYADRKALMQRGIEEVRRLWRGETLRRRSGTGTEVEVGIFPPPLQAELPVWITSARHPDTFRMAGEMGAGLLTHLLGHGADEVAGKIALYREAWRAAGHPGRGHVSLMLHTFVGDDAGVVRETVREPLCAYIKSSFDLLAGLGEASGRGVDFRTLPEAELDALARQAFERFFGTAALLGTPETCADMVDRLKGIDVDEVACLVDFGVAEDEVVAALEHLARAREVSEARRRAAAAEETLAGQLRRHGVTHLQCTPSLAGVLAEDPDAREALGGLRRLLVGGEALPPDLGRRLAAAVGGSVHNLYGPTEATVWATTHRVRDEAGPVPIGRPLANARAYVADRRLRPAPTGVPGELLLGGPGVARGYRGRPGLTAERFVPDPFSGEPGARLYRTGDLARRRTDGRLEFLGRLDHQVKLRGHRIEPGEVEAALRAHPAIREAVAVARGEGAAARLVAFYVPAAGVPAPAEGALRAALRDALPEAMVPAALVALEALPLTPNGKVDRGALPADDRPRPKAQFRPPESGMERTVAEVWREVLRVERVGVDDNFFDLGGNSLLVVQARARLLERVGGELSLVDLFRFPTVGSLTAVLAGAGPAGLALEEVQETAGRRRAALARQGRARQGGRPA
jgi:natural product biosynthesis luciferase-like monooxygenase protein